MAEIVIVGGGVAGLSAGIHAQLDGHRAVVVERHGVPGGNLTGWDREGYHVDNCIHWLTGTNPVTERYRLWRTLGALDGTPVLQPESLYTYERDGRRLTLWRDPERLRRELLAAAPEDAGQIGALLRAVRAMQRLNGVGGAACDRPATAGEKLRALPVLARYLRLSCGELAARFRSPLLRGFLASFLTEDFGALALLSVYATFCSGDGGLPRGGSRAMALRMAERFRGLGGTLLSGTGAVRLVTEGRRAAAVRLADGRTLAADYVVLAVDPAAAFGSLLPAEALPAALRRQYGDPKLRRFSSVHCAFACALPRLPFRGDLLFELPEAAQEELGARRLILREFSHEPSFAPPGRSLLQTMSFCSEAACRRWLALREEPAAYRAEKQRLAEAVRAAVCAQLPALTGTLRLLDVWTPASYRRYVGSEIGSYMSFTLPAGRIPTPLPGRVPGLDNVLLATQWQQAPGGLPIAARAGQAAAQRIRRMERAKKTPDGLPRSNPAASRPTPACPTVR